MICHIIYPLGTLIHIQLLMQPSKISNLTFPQIQNESLNRMFFFFLTFAFQNFSEPLIDLPDIVKSNARLSADDFLYTV